MASLREKLMTHVVQEKSHSNNAPKHPKITVVGVGQVGMAAAYSIMLQGLVNELALVDVVADKLQGEMMDLQHGQQFIKKCVVKASTDYSASAGSNIVVVTAGARQREGESRLNLVQRNVDIMKGLIPQIVKHSPDCIIVVVSNPVDVLTYVVWKLSGFPQHRVFGTGTMLDSARFRFLLSEKLGVSPSSCHGYIIGEHGDSSVPVWSSVNVAGVNLIDVHPEIGTPKDSEHFNDVHKDVVQSAYQIIKLKGYTSWAIGLSISTLCSAIIKNQHQVIPLSTLAKGVHGIDQEIFISLPSVVCGEGLVSIIKQKLNDEETKKLIDSAKTLQEVAQGIVW